MSGIKGAGRFIVGKDRRYIAAFCRCAPILRSTRSLADGETVAFVGGSGTGQSVTALARARLIDQLRRAPGFSRDPDSAPR